MAQNTDVILSTPNYTRADFTALRAWVQRVPIDRIARLYYVDDAPQVDQGLEKYLTSMRHDLIERAIVANPGLADALSKARVGGSITTGILSILVKASEAKPSPPKAADLCSQWFRPGAAKAIAHLNTPTLGDLKKYIERSGPNWWRPIPRMGEKRAKVIMQWLNRHEDTFIRPETQILVLHAQNLSPLTSTPLPVERIASLPHPLDGHDGRNRASAFCFIQARNDLEAIRAYLEKFRNQPNTQRAYQRELERLLLWCVIERKTPLSSMLVHDCEAYKDFLKTPSPAFCGPRDKRLSPRWKPFTGPLSPSSQHQAIQIIRGAFAWLQDVRYLGGNPWTAVSDPRLEKQISPLKLERALPTSLWAKTCAALDIHCGKEDKVQLRIGRAAILILGDSGLRISELAGALTTNLRQSPDADVLLLDVLGKGLKWRTVPLSPRAHAALKAHWKDLPEDQTHLLSPARRPHTPCSEAKKTSGYAPRALARVIEKTLHQISDDPEFTTDEMVKLRTTSAHAFRHTFGMHAVRSMKLNSVREILGHESIDTTSIYSREEEREVSLDAHKFFAKDAAEPPC